MAITPRGREPANIKKRLDTLFPKLNEAYPDKVIRSLAKDHKKWAETVTELYRALGYPDSESFLKAYGYTVERGSQGRPSGDHTAITDELKKRYPNGAPFEKMGELQAANPDLAGKFKTLSNRAKELFGMTLADYFKSIGLLGGSDHKKQLDDLIAELKRRYPEGSVLPATLAQLKEDNADLMTSRLIYIKEVYGVNPQEHLIKVGLLQSDDPLSLFNGFINELRSRYKGKLFPGTLEQYEEENPDLSWSAAKIWVKSAHQITLRAFFKSNDMLGPIITDASQYLVLSADNKTVTDFNPTSGNGERIVKIPAGVEVIQDKAFLYHRFDHLYVPKELKTFGKYTLKNINGQPIRIKFIEVEKGNPYFYTDGTALYRKDGSKDTLMYVFDQSLSSYTFPEGVGSVDPEAFAYCETLSNLTLSEGMETFDEKALPYGTKIRNIHIPAGLKHLIVSPSRTCDSWNSSSNRIQYTIDENNEYLFRDEDSIYEVLEDGSLKLVINMYLGKGRALIRDDTAEIGEQAFFAHKNLSEVELPMSVRCIHAEAFSRCENLKKAIIPSSVSVIAEDAFAHCHYLDSAEADQSSNQLAEKLALRKAELSARFADRKYNPANNTTHEVPSMTTGNTAESTNDIALTKYVETDPFVLFVNMFTSSDSEQTLTDAVYQDYGAYFDAENHSLLVTLPISQDIDDKNLLCRYVETAETIHPGDPLRVKVADDKWTIFSASGKLLGYISTQYWNVDDYQDHITINQCTVAKVTPRSARGKNAKYALVSATFNISGKRLLGATKHGGEV